LNDQGYHQTENDHRNNRKIEFEVFFLNPDISGQPADPVKFAVKEINNYAEDDNKQSDGNDPFAGFAVHGAKVLLNPLKGTLKFLKF